ncbi:hypothetical protein DFH27DRAFT_550731 [Peziza echinospora]|nr:hypothetical protein DFH27DRAFT_550731 [Peziza echinospora]
MNITCLLLSFSFCLLRRSAPLLLPRPLANLEDIVLGGCMAGYHPNMNVMYITHLGKGEGRESDRERQRLKIVL